MPWTNTTVDVLYRDVIQALRAKVVTLEGEVAEREGRVTEAFWWNLPAELGAGLEGLRRAAAGRGATLEAMLRAQQALEAYRDALDAALARVPELESAWDALPATAPVPAAAVQVQSSAREEPTAAERSLGERLRTIVSRHDPAVVLERPRWCGFVARFVVRGVPFALAADGVPQGERGSGRFSEVHLAMATGVRRSMPALRVRPERWTDALARLLRVRRDVELGDPEFDAFFLVAGAPEAARAVLGPAVRAAMLLVAREDVPDLEVGEGAATLRWRFEPTPASVAAAVRALAGIRDAPARRPLLRPGSAAR